jgi:hypothetical protein
VQIIRDESGRLRFVPKKKGEGVTHFERSMPAGVLSSMDRIEKLKREQAEQLAALVDKEKLRELLPASIRESASITKHKDHYTVTGWNGFAYDNPPKFLQAVKLIEQFAEAEQLVVGEHWKGACCSTYPARINSVKEKEPTSIMEGSHTIEIKVQGGRGFQTIEVRFWAELGEQFAGGVETYLAEIVLPVTDLWQLAPNVRATYNTHGDVANCEIHWPEESRVVDSFRKWYSERPSYSGSYYLADWHNFNSWASTMLAGAAAPPYNKGIGGGVKEKEDSNAIRS